MRAFDFKKAYWAARQNIPTRGLVFYHPLATASTTPEVGATMTKSGTLTATVEDGIPCVYFPGNSWMYSSEYFNGTEGTISAWVKPVRQYNSSIFHAHVVSLSDGVEAHISPPCTFKQSNKLVNYNSPEVFSKWHWVATTFVLANESVMLYCDNMATQKEALLTKDISRYASIGTFGTLSRYSMIGYVAAARVYNRVLRPDELLVLAHEFTPTA